MPEFAIRFEVVPLGPLVPRLHEKKLLFVRAIAEEIDSTIDLGTKCAGVRPG